MTYLESKSLKLTIIFGDSHEHTYIHTDGILIVRKYKGFWKPTYGKNLILRMLCYGSNVNDTRPGYLLHSTQV